MSLVARTIQSFEGAPAPDPLRRGAIALLVARASRDLDAAPADASSAFAQAMRKWPIAEHTHAANAQHYEVPTAFFQKVLGPHLKYSCCLYDHGAISLAEAEAAALVETCAHADLRDGQRILELGCGWGSLTLWMAQRYPGAQILAVSNSATQRAHIEAQAAARGLRNVRVTTADMNTFATPERFDRIVSVEMFEHMANWSALLQRCKSWLAPDGRMFIHVFANRAAPYRFNPADEADWIAQHFFSGGVMPSRDLIHNFEDAFVVEDEWWWCGSNYTRTANDWLANFDERLDHIRPVLSRTYGSEARLWERRWRLFFMATAGMFGHDRGNAWGVAHYRLTPS